MIFDPDVLRKATNNVLSQQNLRARSQITIEDLESKKGTLVNGVQIRGEKKVLSEEENEIQLGACSKPLRWVFPGAHHRIY